MLHSHSREPAALWEGVSAGARVTDSRGPVHSPASVTFYLSVDVDISVRLTFSCSSLHITVPHVGECNHREGIHMVSPTSQPKSARKERRKRDVNQCYIMR